ncbi:hypothetical protein EB796_022571 [Bugula neritina]|uniref:Uncharacterized protein n=1 Tax=Bugula neritina TaxID=10212 RepID=A0A7J7J0J4_BUGNE|nr:hypothetical protein EB796_022571 [Bugula neritina]
MCMASAFYFVYLRLRNENTTNFRVNNYQHNNKKVRRHKKLNKINIYLVEGRPGSRISLEFIILVFYNILKYCMS